MRRQLPERKLVRRWGLMGLAVGGFLPYSVCYLSDPSVENWRPLWSLVVLFCFFSVPFAFLFRWFVGLLFEVAWHCDEQAFACGLVGGLVGAGAGLMPYLPLGAGPAHRNFLD